VAVRPTKTFQTLLRPCGGQRSDRYSEIRTAQTSALQKVEMSYIGG
jgi:hypothetical protein